MLKLVYRRWCEIKNRRHYPRFVAPCLEKKLIYFNLLYQYRIAQLMQQRCFLTSYQRLSTKRILYSILLCIVSTQSVKAEPFLPIEKNIREYLISHQQEQLALLEKLVNINSGTANISGVHQVGEILRPQFEQLGFNTRWIEVPPAMLRAGTLIAERKGSKGKRILLIGHLDTVFPPESPFQHYKQQGNTVTGPGVIDDKGGIIVILYALKTLYITQALDDTSITVILTGDEENSGQPPGQSIAISRKALIEAANHSDIALDFEWSFTLDTATIARRGIASWTIETSGKEAHSSTIFQKPTGSGAIFELTRILNSVMTTLANEKYLSFNPGLILGGTTITQKSTSEGTAFGNSNVIAKTALATGDLRFLNEDQKLNAEKRMTTIVNHHLPGTTATISFKDEIPSMPLTTANKELLTAYSDISHKLGYGYIQLLDPGLRGAADISYIASIVTANLAGLGPVGSDAHSDKETLDINSLSIQTERAANLIYQLTR